MNVTVLAVHPEGGIRTYFAYIYGNKAMSDVRFTLVSPETTASEFFYRQIGNSFKHIQTNYSLFKLFLAFVKNLWQENPSLVHSHGFTAIALACIPAKVLGIPHIATTHDVLQESQFTGVKGIIKRLVMKVVLNIPDLLNPVGEDAKDNLLSVYPNLSKSGHLQAIRNGIDTKFFYQHERRNLRREVNIASNAILLGFFGRFMSQKGFSLLVNAVEQWNQSQSGQEVHVACFGWGGFIREEQRELKVRKLDQYFHFFPNTDEMPKALRGVDAVAMPSLWEACPLLPMEALVSGAPLIASDCIGTAEVVKDTPSLVFKKGDLQDFLRRLKEFVDNKNEKVSQAEAFREEAVKRFDVEKTVTSLCSLYDQMKKTP